jgi:hypothetical protein
VVGTLSVLLVACLDKWQLEPGIFLGSGRAQEVLADHRGTFVRADGWRRDTPAKLTDVALFYALVLEPGAKPTGVGSSYRTEKTVTSVELSWAFGERGFPSGRPRDKSLTLSFDGRSKLFTVATQTFDTLKGNFFVVTLDREWAPSIVQLPHVVLEQLPLQEALDVLRFHPAAPEVARVVKLYSESPRAAVDVPPEPLVAVGATRALSPAFSRLPSTSCDSAQEPFRVSACGH